MKHDGLAELLVSVAMAFRMIVLLSYPVCGMLNIEIHRDFQSDVIGSLLMIMVWQVMHDYE